MLEEAKKRTRNDATCELYLDCYSEIEESNLLAQSIPVRRESNRVKTIEELPIHCHFIVK
jgi:hypothetical protein